jgi:hypothetical protein
VAGEVGAFARKIPLLGNSTSSLDTDDIALFPQGMILRIVVYNGLAPAAFQVAGRVELFRTITK